MGRFRRERCICPNGRRANGSSSSWASSWSPSSTKRGFARLEWQKLRERNEALDCRVYARAAAWIAGADRWSDAKWRDLEDQLGVADAAADPAGQINRQAPAQQGKRRSDWLGRRGGWF